MPIKTQPLELPTLNLTPMLDVVFNLIIFFMVGTQFVEMERVIEVSVPQVRHVQPASSPRSKRIVNMVADGVYMLGSDPVTLTQLIERLAQARREDPSVRAIVRGNHQCSLQSLGEVLDAITAAGITDIDMAVRPK